MYFVFKFIGIKKIVRTQLQKLTVLYILTSYMHAVRGGLRKEENCPTLNLLGALALISR